MLDYEKIQRFNIIVINSIMPKTINMFFNFFNNIFYCLFIYRKALPIELSTCSA